MTGLAPLSATPAASQWPATDAVSAAGVARARDLPVTDAVWTVEIQGAGSGGVPAPAPAGLVSGLPLSSIALPDDGGGSATVVRVSDRGWITEPDDAVPNQAWPPRLLEPPALEMQVPLYPGEGRRAEVAAGEVLLANGDGALDALVSDWTLSGLGVVIRRGPHRRPIPAASHEVGRIAEMRVARPLDGAGRLRLVLGSAARDLAVPACPVFAGTGGEEGPEALAGQNKPRLFGHRQNFAPVLVDAARQIYLVAVGPIGSVVEVRNRGVAQDPYGEVGNYQALEEAYVPGSHYMVCLATGHIRLGSAPSLLTVTAQGDAAPATGGYLSDPADLAVKLLQGPGGLDPQRAPREAFSAWPTGPAGLLVTGGTVADAMERLAAGVNGWWGADEFGRMRGGALVVPETVGPGVALEPWMLLGRPEEEAQSQPPWWRARVRYAVRDVVQLGENVAQGAGAEARDYYGREGEVVTNLNAATQGAFPSAADGPVLDSPFVTAEPAQALADRLMALFGVPRRSWRVSLRSGASGISPAMVRPGTVLQLTYPRVASLAQGRNLLVLRLSVRGDTLTLLLWG
ncbi:hypothetical protein [Teichococcus aestuarii]|uniref:hypothetical protein n=1 Tax=Teichococcus aestuarii TaxID=568898 RepID=UPI00361460D7